MMKRYQQDLEKQNNGKSRTTMLKSTHKQSWIWGNRGRLIQALSGTLPTMINKTRGRGILDEKRCKRCRSGATEEDAHILASCKYNKDLIKKRHDYVTKKIAEEFLRNRATAKIWRERSWRTRSEIL